MHVYMHIQNRDMTSKICPCPTSLKYKNST